MLETGRSPMLRYAVAVLSVALVTLIRLLLHSILGEFARFLPFVLAVMFTAWYGGLRPGLLATALSAITASYLFLEPMGRPLSLTLPRDAVQLALFCVIGVVISFLNNALKSEVAERRHAEQASMAQTQALVDVIERLAQEHDLERLQGLVLAAIVSQLNAAGGALWSHNEDTDVSQIVLDCRGRGDRVETAAAAGHPLAGQEVSNRDTPGWQELKASYLRGECLQVPDLPSDTRLPERIRASLLQMGVQSLLIVPMLLQGRLVGFYSARNCRHTRYDRGEIQLAQALAHQATLAIHMARLAEQARQSAILEERNRMAREIHDTLAQAFTGILLQLGAAERLLGDAPEHGQAHLQSARDLAREGLGEARRSVQALRPHALEKADLASALERMTEQLNADQATRIEFRLSGAPRPLPPDVADHLLRIGQEALTNALRHAHASAVAVALTFAEKELRLRVEDDGRGFGIEAPRGKEGFGLTGMRERAGLIGADLTVASQSGSGTRMELTWQFPRAGPKTG
jgi:signal transduction histidine kinase